MAQSVQNTRDFNAAPLFFEAERMNLRGVSVDCYCGDSIDAGEISQVTAIGSLVDLQMGVERHKAGRDDAFWIELVVTHWAGLHKLSSIL